MALPEARSLRALLDQPPRVNAIETPRTELPPRHDHGMQPGSPNRSDAGSQKKNDVALAMTLAREAVTTAAKAAEDELRHLREQLAKSEARARAAEERARVAEAQRAEAEKLIAEIRDQILAKVDQRRAA